MSKLLSDSRQIVPHLIPFVNRTLQMTWKEKWWWIDSLTRWNWEQVTSWNWVQDWIWTKSGKLRIGHECVATMHDADTNEDMTTFTDFHIVWAWARIDLFLLVLPRHISRTHAVAQVWISWERCSSRYPLPHHALLAALLPFLLALEIRRQPTHSTNDAFVCGAVMPRQAPVQFLNLSGPSSCVHVVTSSADARISYGSSLISRDHTEDNEFLHKQFKYHIVWESCSGTTLMALREHVTDNEQLHPIQEITSPIPDFLEH